MREITFCSIIIKRYLKSIEKRYIKICWVYNIHVNSYSYDE